MTYRHPATKLLSALLLAVFALAPAHAGIRGTTSTGVSLGNASATTSEAFTSEDLTLMRDKRKQTSTSLKKLDTKIKAMAADLKAGKPSATQAKLDKLKQQHADAQELLDALDMLILQAKADIKAAKSDDDNDTSTDTRKDEQKQQDDAFKQLALNSLLQGVLGGNNSALNGLMGNLTGGLTNGLNGLTGGNNLTGGLTGGTGSTTGGTEDTLTVTDETPKDDKKAAEEDLPECTPATEDDNSPGRRKAETGNIEGTQTATASSNATGSTTETNPGKLDDDYVGPKPTENPGKKADDKLANNPKKPEKRKCKPIDVATPNPTSSGSNLDGKAPNMYGVKSLEDAKKLIEAQGGNCTTTAKNGISCSVGGRTIGVSAQCAAFPRSEIPHGTPSWREGDPVDENTPIGTWVATFNNGDKYGPNHSPVGDYGFSHTGMYLGRTSDGSIILLDQFKKGKLNIRTYSCNGGLEGCDKYYTIRHPGTAWLKPLLQPYQLAHNVVFFAKTLLIG